MSEPANTDELRGLLRIKIEEARMRYAALPQRLRRMAGQMHHHVHKFRALSEQYPENHALEALADLLLEITELSTRLSEAEEAANQVCPKAEPDLRLGKTRRWHQS